MEANQQKMEALLQYFNQPSLNPKMIDEEFERQGRDIGVKVAKNIIETRNQLRNQNGVGFTDLKQIDDVSGVGPAKFKMILEHFGLGDPGSSDAQSPIEAVCIHPRDLRTEIRQILNTEMGHKQQPFQIGSGPNLGSSLYTHQANLIGMNLPILADTRTEIAKWVLEQIMENLKDKGGDDGKTTADSSVTFPCEAKYSATVRGEGFNKEYFWWRVSKKERDQYDPVQKKAAQKAAQAALDVRLKMLRAFQCQHPCKRFFEVTYGEPTFEDFVWPGSDGYTYVTWKCVIKATVKYGCKK